MAVRNYNKYQKYGKRSRYSSGNYAIKKAKYTSPPPPNKFIALKGEVKFLDTAVTVATLASGAAAVSKLTEVAQGAARNNRIGREIHVLGVDINGRITNAPLDVHLCSPTDNHDPVYADFFNAIGGFPVSDLVKDWYHTTGSNRASNTNMVTKKYRFKYPLRVLYKDANASSGLRNRLFLVLSNTTGNDITAISITCRIYYQDM